LAKAMGENINLLPEKEKAFAFISALKKLIKNIGMNDLQLSDFGIQGEEIEILAKNSMDTMGSLFKSSDPYKLSLEEVKSIYKACL
jgi:alcohol dehydrogenase